MKNMKHFALLSAIMCLFGTIDVSAGSCSGGACKKKKPSASKQHKAVFTKSTRKRSAQSRRKRRPSASTAINPQIAELTATNEQLKKDNAKLVQVNNEQNEVLPKITRALKAEQAKNAELTKENSNQKTAIKHRNWALMGTYGVAASAAAGFGLYKYRAGIAHCLSGLPLIGSYFSSLVPRDKHSDSNPRRVAVLEKTISELTAQVEEIASIEEDKRTPEQKEKLDSLKKSLESFKEKLALELPAEPAAPVAEPVAPVDEPAAPVEPGNGE